MPSRYYDWQALHHQPLPQEVYRRGGGRLGGLVRPEDIRKYHKRLHTGREGRGMVNMAYNMIYAGNRQLFTDAAGILQQRRLEALFCAGQ